MDVLKSKCKVKNNHRYVENTAQHWTLRYENVPIAENLKRARKQLTKARITPLRLHRFEK